MQAAPGRTVKRDVQRKTQKLLQFQICSDYTSVAHKILKGLKRVDAGLTLPALLEGGRKLLLGLRLKIHLKAKTSSGI